MIIGFGVIVTEPQQQRNLEKMINILKTYEVTEQQLSILVEKAKAYKKDMEKIQENF